MSQPDVSQAYTGVDLIYTTQQRGGAKLTHFQGLP